MIQEHRPEFMVILLLPWWNNADDELEYSRMTIATDKPDRRKAKRLARRWYQQAFGQLPDKWALERVWRRRFVVKTASVEAMQQHMMRMHDEANIESADTQSESTSIGEAAVEVCTLPLFPDGEGGEGLVSGSLPQTGAYQGSPVPELQRDRGEDIQPSEPRQEELFCTRVLAANPALLESACEPGQACTSP